MKILVLSNLYPPDMLGGYELGCRQVVDALRERGHEVRVLTSTPRRPVPQANHVKRRLKLADIWSHALYNTSHPVNSHLVYSSSMHVNASNCHVLIDEINEFEPDVVYVWMLTGIGGLGLMGCLEFLKVPWVWHLMDQVPNCLCWIQGQAVGPLMRTFERAARRGRYLSCSQQLVSEIESDGISLGEHVEVLPNWVTGTPATPRQRYLPDGILRIAAASAIIQRGSDKGIDIVVKAAARLRELGHENFEIDIFGLQIDSSMAELALSLGLQRHVRFRGALKQADLIARYDQYDLFAFPTRTREPFGFAALEAGARGCVPVMTNVCGIAEWFVHGVHVLKADRTPEAMAAAFSAVLKGSFDLTALGRRLHSVIRRDFHLSALLPRIESALREASQEPKGVAGSAEDAYRLALLAERLSQVLVQEPWLRSA